MLRTGTTTENIKFRLLLEIFFFSRLDSSKRDIFRDACISCEHSALGARIQSNPFPLSPSTSLSQLSPILLHLPHLPPFLALAWPALSGRQIER